MSIYGKFYSPEKILSYGRPYNFCVGARTVGKSTGWALETIGEFLKDGWLAIYIRRTLDELRLTSEGYFDTAAFLMGRYLCKDIKIVYKGGEYQCNGKLFGYAIPLSLQQKYKSSCYERVRNMIYDEFMIMPGSQARYIGGKNASGAEVEAMSSLYQTVDRGPDRAFRNEARVIFIGNAGTYYNPFFIDLGIDRFLRPDTKYLAPKGALYVVEQTFETEATKDIKQSYSYQLSSQKTKDYAYGNKYADLLRSKDFIERTPSGERSPLITMVYEGQMYAVYAYMDKGYIWIGHGRCDGKPVLSLTCEDHRPNYLLISQWRGNYITNLVKQMYDRGSIRFADQKCKMVLDFYLRYDII